MNNIIILKKSFKSQIFAWKKYIPENNGKFLSNEPQHVHPCCTNFASLYSHVRLLEVFQKCIKTSCNVFVFFLQIIKQVPVRFDPKTLHIPAYSGMDLTSSACAAVTHCCKTSYLPLQIIHSHSFRALNFSETIVVYAMFLARPILSSLFKYKHLNFLFCFLELRSPCSKLLP